MIPVSLGEARGVRFAGTGATAEHTAKPDTNVKLRGKVVGKNRLAVEGSSGSLGGVGRSVLLRVLLRWPQRKLSSGPRETVQVRNIPAEIFQLCGVPALFYCNSIFFFLNGRFKPI